MKPIVQTQMWNDDDEPLKKGAEIQAILAALASRMDSHQRDAFWDTMARMDAQRMRAARRSPPTGVAFLQ